MVKLEELDLLRRYNGRSDRRTTTRQGKAEEGYEE